MEISIDSLFSFEKALSETKEVFDLVDKNGKVVLLKDNRPVYIIMKYEESTQPVLAKHISQKSITLQEAMKAVLMEADNQTLHASVLADIIFERKLYTKKNGDKAQYNQIRARCGHYPEMFEALPRNYIRLK